jgi:pilus assembly protein CpaF
VEVAGYEDGEIRLNPLYRFEEYKGARGKTKEVGGILKKVGNLENTEKLEAAGIKL